MANQKISKKALKDLIKFLDSTTPETNLHEYAGDPWNWNTPEDVPKCIKCGEAFDPEKPYCDKG